MDVISSNECTVQLQETGKLVEVKLRMLETVIPKAGEKVLIVSGHQSGRTGKLMLKEKDQNGDVHAVVQLLNDLSIDTYELDCICQYVGEQNL